jgi:sugar phosphate isomerase/epimerase
VLRVITRRIVSVSTYAFDGYPLERALDECAGLGIRSVEPCGMAGVFEQLAEEDFCDRRAAWLAAELRARGLTATALSAHMDLTRPDSVARFTRRLEFARAIGAQLVNTNCGPAENAEGFWRNLPPLAARAADLEVVLALENHGDMLHRAADILAVFRSIDNPAVRLNYDTGNAWYYARGRLDPAAELAEVAPLVAHVHLKEPEVEAGMLRWVALGDGVLDEPALGQVLRERLPAIPVSIEIALRQRSQDFEPRWRAPEIPELHDIRTAIRRSLEAVARMTTTPGG